jgi:hypothetical protein
LLEFITLAVSSVSAVLGDAGSPPAPERTGDPAQGFGPASSTAAMCMAFIVKFLLSLLSGH